MHKPSAWLLLAHLEGVALLGPIAYPVHYVVQGFCGGMPFALSKGPEAASPLPHPRKLVQASRVQKGF